MALQVRSVAVRLPVKMLSGHQKLTFILALSSRAAYSTRLLLSTSDLKTRIGYSGVCHRISSVNQHPLGLKVTRRVSGGKALTEMTQREAWSNRNVDVAVT